MEREEALVLFMRAYKGLGSDYGCHAVYSR